MIPFFEKVKKMYFKASETHDAEGRELADSRPMELPVGFKRPPTLQEELAQLLRSRDLVAAQVAAGDETLDDSLDFGEDDEQDPEAPLSVHQVRDMQEEVLREGAAEHRQEEVRKKKPRQEKKAEEQNKGDEKPVEKVEEEGAQKAP